MQKILLSFIPGFILISALLLLSCSGDEGSTNSTNHPPVIQSITSDPEIVGMTDTTMLICEADDADMDNLYIVWSAEFGAFVGAATGDTVSWTAPATAGNYFVSVTAYDDVSNDKDSLEIEVGIVYHPPTAPVNPTPEHLADSVSIYTDLSWECVDPDGDTLTYDIYFEDNSSPELVVSGQLGETYDPGVLPINTTFYWIVAAHDQQGHIVDSEVWRFTTGVPSNYHPIEPSDPSPSHLATGIPIDADLTWTCSDPENDPMTFDLYFGTTDPPPLAASDLTVTGFSPGSLSGNTAYYWQVEAKDDQGNTTLGPLWQFTTTALYMIVGSIDLEDARSVAVNIDYAYVAEYYASKLTVLDITDPADPVITGETVIADAYDVDIYYDNDVDYAIVAGREGGIYVVDVTDPYFPSVVGSIDTYDALSVTVNQALKLVFVGDGEEGLKIISLDDPVNPVIIKSCDTDNAKDVTYSSQAVKAYVADGTSGMKIIRTNLSSSSEAEIIGSLNNGLNLTDGIAYKYKSLSEIYAIIADNGGFGDSGLKIVDVSDDNTPYVFGFGETFYGTDLKISGNTVFIADGSRGLKVFDITDIANPIQIGSCDTFQAKGVDVFGNYAYIADADDGAGLKIILINE